MSVQRAAVATVGLSLWLLVLGFVMFATTVMREPAALARSADGIVVLTGGETRIAEGARLLREGRAGRLLISGVDRIVSRDDLLRLSGLDASRFDCCVDLGYHARDTIGNANEAHLWAREKGYRSLIVVTSGYHMPRSMAELSREMPGVELIPHPVVSKSRQRVWWLHPGTARTLLSEYLKFLPAAARFGVARLLGARDGHAVAVVQTSDPMQ